MARLCTAAFTRIHTCARAAGLQNIQSPCLCASVHIHNDNSIFAHNYIESYIVMYMYIHIHVHVRLHMHM